MNTHYCTECGEPFKSGCGRKDRYGRRFCTRGCKEEFYRKQAEDLLHVPHDLEELADLATYGRSDY